ncbi:MAG: PQQ-binding-like beta-propeller repeat protein [Acidobacteriota bacterium]
MDTSKPLRLWPGWAVALTTLLAVALSITPSIQNTVRFILMFAGPLLGALLFVVWLLLLSRLPAKERWLCLLLAFGPAAVPLFVGDPSISTALWLYGVPLSLLATMVTLTLTRRRGPGRRLASLGAISVACWAFFALWRLEGFDGGYLPELAWRGAPTSEELMADIEVSSSKTGVDWTAGTAEWPGFRGARGDSRAPDVTEALDWATAPPEELWRTSVGPAWSSFAFAQGRLFTQEQRGDFEVISSLDAATGERIWEHRFESRFQELVSGSGPRATPTLAGERLFALGGRGVLVALDARTGEELWRRDLMQEMGAPLPMWGFSSSPAVAGGHVIVHAGPSTTRGLIALSVADGELAWSLSTEGINFSSAQPMVLRGVEIVLFGDKAGLVAVDPATGDVAWRFKPSAWEGPSMVQPQAVGGGTVLTALGDGIGTARIDVELRQGEWHLEERWSSIRLKPSYNDFVVHAGHIYGFDQNIFASVDLETGERNWKRGRYGFGQVLVTGGGQLIVQAESGDIRLLAADPAAHRELGRFDALEDKTWNHPIVADGTLFVRNGREIVAFRL